MPEKLWEEYSKIIYQMGWEREDGIINGKTKLTVAAIFLIDDNWKIFKEYRDIFTALQETLEVAYNFIFYVPSVFLRWNCCL